MARVLNNVSSVSFMHTVCYLAPACLSVCYLNLPQGSQNLSGGCTGTVQLQVKVSQLYNHLWSSCQYCHLGGPVIGKVIECIFWLCINKVSSIELTTLTQSVEIIRCTSGVFERLYGEKLIFSTYYSFKLN